MALVNQVQPFGQMVEFRRQKEKIQELEAQPEVQPEVTVDCCCFKEQTLPPRRFFWLVIFFMCSICTTVTTLLVCLTAVHATSVLAPTFTATTELINNVNLQTTTLGNETALLMSGVQDHWSIPAVTLNLNPDAAPPTEPRETTPPQLTNLGRGGRRSLMSRWLNRV